MDETYNYITCVILILSAVTFVAAAQTAVVTQISIRGNEKTHNSVILREILHPIPGPYNPSIAEDDRNRIYNLGIFSTVEITREDSLYVVFVVEGPRWIPFPMIHYDEAKGKNGWSYGLGLSLLNFRGVDETAEMGFTIGDVKNYFISLYDPWIIGNHISLGLTTFRETNTDAAHPYNLTRQHFSVNTGFYIRQEHKFNALAGFNHRSLRWISENGESLVNLPAEYYNHLVLKLLYEFDTRDIFIDPEHGLQTGFEISLNPGIDRSVNYSAVKIWIKKWIMLNHRPSEPVLSVKTVAEFQFSEQLPIFRHLYLGGEGFVRGYSPVPADNPAEVQDRIENLNIIYQCLSYQQTLFPRKDFTGMELGIDWHVFFDWGLGADSLKDFRVKHSIYGYGFGLVLFASGFGSVTIDFGYNPYETDTHIHLSDSN